MHQLRITRRVALGATFAAPFVRSVRAADPVKIGFIATMSGPFATTGEIMSKSAQLFLDTHGRELLGDIPVELIVRDDGGANPDTAKRLVQELVTRDRVQYVAGFQWTPNANAVAPLLNQAKTPCILMNASGANTTRLSPWFVRTAFTQWQVCQPLGTWAAGTRKWRKAYVLVTDFGPGKDAEAAFTKGFKEAGGEIVGAAAMPIQSPNFVPFLLRAKEARPEIVFGFHPGGVQASSFMKAATEAGLREAGIQLIGSQDLTSEEELPNMGDAALGVITAGQYSLVADRPANRAFVEAWKAKYGFKPVRPNYMAVGVWDGMHAICTAIKTGGGRVDADAAMRVLANFATDDSPRGPIRIDPATRDIVQNIYIREVKDVNGELGNVEFATVAAVKDPWKELNPA
ncbi:MAG: ABC transporter substrate-binding protein [Acetobacteraceae bacterium]|nr:ABC transporter substrate-binding protein [Acetobacteraceae bacterium]